MTSIWNNTGNRIKYIVENSYIINEHKEQHNTECPYSGYVVTGMNTIHPGAHVIKGDVFTDNISGALSTGWIYGIEITDRTNNREYDIQFELGSDRKWRYININVSKR